ncbi:MAG: hypothetical protein OEL83_18930 [Desulforhopalus sp.]|nr:hypothetical protein [Desulforhopalus sp.]
MGRPDFFPRFVAIVLLIAASLVISGCGAKHKVAVYVPEVVELDPGRQRLADWYALIKEKRDSPEMEKLESVNNFFNQLEFVDDRIHWGKDDYWATPPGNVDKQRWRLRGFCNCQVFYPAHA